MATSSLAAVCAFASGTAKADSFSTRDGQSTCQVVVDNSDGRRVEFFGEVDTDTDNATIGFRYVIEFQKNYDLVDRCAVSHRLATQHMQLDLEKKELELGLLRLRAEEATQPQGSRDEHDW